MLEVIGGVLGVFLMLLGFVEIFKHAVLLILRMKGEKEIMIVVPVRGHNEEAELLLRSAAERVRWAGDMRDSRVICLDCDMDEETRKICTLIAKDYSFMEIRTLPEFEALFSDKKPLYPIAQQEEDQV
ncbi:MAG TPA: hypothetical protein IAA58_08910 [Candidatus Gallacutalibacter stercoravium]|nr:hypothetical protein [Candidatus Gallacutalibacter stercoravium]